MSTLLIILIILVFFSSGVGYYGTNAGWGYAGWSPLMVILLFLIVLLLTGRLN